MALAASADDDAVLDAARRADATRVMRALEKLPPAPKDATKMVEGDWKVEWDSNYNGGHHKTLVKFINEMLPSVMVDVHTTYNRVTAKEYQWIMGFTIDGVERVDAALVLAGPIGKKGFGYKWETVHFAVSDSAEAESREMLQSAGLGKFLKPVKIKKPEDYTIVIKHQSKDVSVQKDEAGTTFVLSKLAADKSCSRIPYTV